MNGAIVMSRNRSTLPRAALVGLEKKIEPAIDTTMAGVATGTDRLGVDEPGERRGFGEPGVSAHVPPGTIPVTFGPDGQDRRPDFGSSIGRWSGWTPLPRIRRIPRDGHPPFADASERFLNRELSWLDFNARVLALAEDDELPLLERAKFLAIFSQNLDEFFQVRVSGLQEQLDAGLRTTTARRPRPRRAAPRDPRPGRRRSSRAPGGRVHQGDRARARRRGHPLRRLGRASTADDRGAPRRGLRRRASSRCSPRSRSTPRTRSRTSRTCR